MMMMMMIVVTKLTKTRDKDVAVCDKITAMILNPMRVRSHSLCLRKYDVWGNLVNPTPPILRLVA
jgi:hypothetical protein